jgi:hypothetical protein
VLTPNSFGEERNSSPPLFSQRERRAKHNSLFLTSFVPPFANPFPLGKREKKGRTKKQPLWFAKGGVAKQTQRGKESVKKGFYFKTISRRVAIFHPFPSALSSPCIPSSPFFPEGTACEATLRFAKQGEGKKHNRACFATPLLAYFEEKTLFSPLGFAKQRTERSKE